VEVVAQLVDRGTAGQGPLASGVVSRCQGLVAASDYEQHFRDALAKHASVPCPFVHARTVLCFGERLRRDRRYAEAATHLQDAAATFRRLDATPWLRRAIAELEATGENAPKSHAARSGALTPQEFRVAVQIGRGDTTREAAAALFLSPRTVDHHLQGVYRKLGLHSRTELVRRVANDPELADDLAVDPPGESTPAHEPR
jgi:DNA-binding CsgD family transcriptional regulator